MVMWQLLNFYKAPLPALKSSVPNMTCCLYSVEVKHGNPLLTSCWKYEKYVFLMISRFCSKIQETWSTASVHF